MSNFMSRLTWKIFMEGWTGLWQVQVKDVLIQFGLHKALNGRPSGGMSLGIKTKLSLQSLWILRFN